MSRTCGLAWWNAAFVAPSHAPQPRRQKPALRAAIAAAVRMLVLRTLWPLVVWTGTVGVVVLDEPTDGAVVVKLPYGAVMLLTEVELAFMV